MHANNHHALRNLSRWQSNAKRTQILSAFRSPRRQFVSLLAVILGIAWLGQAIASIAFRQSADPAQLAIWLPLGFFTYSSWHWLRTIGSKSVEPFDWTPAEQEHLCGAPFTRQQLIAFRMSSIVRSALLKSICFSLLMIPDLHVLVAGFIGMFTALLLVDLIRVLIQLICYGFSVRARSMIRWFTYSSMALWMGSVVWTCLNSESATAQLASPGGLYFAREIASTLSQQLTTNAGWLMAIFQPSTNVILTESWNLACCVNFLLSVSLIFICWRSVIRLDGWVDAIIRIREQRRCETRWGHDNVMDQSQGTKKVTNRGNMECHAEGANFSVKKGDRRISPLSGQVPVGESVGTPSGARFFTALRFVQIDLVVCLARLLPRQLRGAGTIAWRQWLGAWHYRGSLLISIGVPIGLSCIPMMAAHAPLQMLLNIIGGIVFYSFLLLPPALMLDFRRDINRLAVLKALPITPLAVTIGQLATPVSICLLFQWIVLAIAAINGSIVAWQAMMAGILLVPICVLIFAAENLIFMLSPYQRNAEGLDVFLRTILTFTAKGILFALALTVVLLWALGCRTIGNWSGNSVLTGGILFGIGVWLMSAGSAWFATQWLAKLYRDYDPSLDAIA